MEEAGRVVVYIALCMILPISLLCFFLESRTRKILISVDIGIIDCLIAYFINTLIFDASGVTSLYFSATFAPMVEELLKFIPIIIIVYGLKKGIRASVANAFAVGVGFCIVENCFYLFEYMETANLIWIILRCFGTGLMHSMCAVLACLGFQYAKNDKRMRYIVIVTSYFIAVLYHGLYNLLVSCSNIFFAVGVLVPIATFILTFIFIKSGKYREYFVVTKENKEIENK